MTPTEAKELIESEAIIDPNNEDPAWVIIENWEVSADFVAKWLEGPSERLQSIALYIFSELGDKNQSILSSALGCLNHPWPQARAYLLEGLLPHISGLDDATLSRIRNMPSEEEPNLKKYIALAISQMDMPGD